VDFATRAGIERLEAAIQLADSIKTVDTQVSSFFSKGSKLHQKQEYAHIFPCFYVQKEETKKIMWKCVGKYTVPNKTLVIIKIST
jgi:hypothetical protein